MDESYRRWLYDSWLGLPELRDISQDESMSAAEYLQTLIDGQKISTIPVQVSELEYLQMLMKMEKK